MNLHTGAANKINLEYWKGFKEICNFKSVYPENTLSVAIKISPLYISLFFKFSID